MNMAFLLLQSLADGAEGDSAAKKASSAAAKETLPLDTNSKAGVLPHQDLIKFAATQNIAHLLNNCRKRLLTQEGWPCMSVPLPLACGLFTATTTALLSTLGSRVARHSLHHAAAMG